MTDFVSFLVTVLVIGNRVITGTTVLEPAELTSCHRASTILPAVVTFSPQDKKDLKVELLFRSSSYKVLGCLWVIPYGMDQLVMETSESCGSRNKTNHLGSQEQWMSWPEIYLYVSPEEKALKIQIINEPSNFTTLRYKYLFDNYNISGSVLLLSVNSTRTCVSYNCVGECPAKISSPESLHLMKSFTESTNFSLYPIHQSVELKVILQLKNCLNLRADDEVYTLSLKEYIKIGVWNNLTVTVTEKFYEVSINTHLIGNLKSSICSRLLNSTMSITGEAIWTMNCTPVTVSDIRSVTTPTNLQYSENYHSNPSSTEASKSGSEQHDIGVDHFAFLLVILSFICIFVIGSIVDLVLAIRLCGKGWK